MGARDGALSGGRGVTGGESIVRVMWFLIGVVLTFGFLGFLVTNFDTRVPVTLITTVYPDVALWLVVLVALLVMSVLVGVAAIAEGAAVRLENRRLRREVHKLENEINYFRTQPSVATRGEQAPPPAAPAEAAEENDDLASAPVYGEARDDWSPDTDDDAYSGGRAV